MVVHGSAVTTGALSLINLSTVSRHTESVLTLLRHLHQQLKLWLDDSFLAHTNVPENAHCAPEDTRKTVLIPIQSLFHKCKSISIDFSVRQ